MDGKEQIRAIEKTILLLPNTPKAQLLAARLGDRLTQMLGRSTIKRSKRKEAVRK